MAKKPLVHLTHIGRVPFLIPGGSAGKVHFLTLGENSGSLSNLGLYDFLKFVLQAARGLYRSCYIHNFLVRPPFAYLR